MDTAAAPARSPRLTVLDRLQRWAGNREVQAVGPFRTERVAIPGTDQTLAIERPYPEDRDPEAYLPHWAEIWPAGVVLAGYLARQPWLLQGKRVLEIGPGAGLTAVAAMQAGAELVVVDYAAASLALTVRNARKVVGYEPKTMLLDWHHPTSQFMTLAGEGFGIVLGADMLYQSRDVRPLARFLARVVAADGEVWIAEPGREAAEELAALLRSRGWQGPTEECASPVPDPQDGSWDIMRTHRLRHP